MKKIIDEEWMKHFSSYMHQVDELEELAEDLAYAQIRFGSDNRFIEGFGPVTRNGKLPFDFSDYKDGNLLPEAERDKPADGFNIIIKSEEDYDFETTEDPS